jgi:maltose alpha-D-glucosyltransferase / alpha-amylase
LSETSPARYPQWYRDAVIYQLHVKAFKDANGDGIGDFAGLRQQLDYVQDLGVDTLWLLPFYPSPQRDDGYDIADYRSINPAYGTMRDFRQFVREAHRRGLRVVTELVINHTSDQHPWFQRARRAARGSAARDMYVWSDTDKALAGTRIIFSDTEVSNWAWDPVANAYYWHRFFSHQPDLNHNNPRVVREVARIMRYWLDMGVDGFRLDAIPYLCVREGTDNENLPETHAVIRQLRQVVDGNYSDRLLLAEANQWPEDVREYFGNGDECHMAYHFPLMPRMYMALALEDRYPVVEIMEQTPAIPDGCQWAIFLRNHDELTLEMVTDQERDYMYRMYASEPRMRVNVGIRRRLAPLLDNDQDKVRLMNSLLLSMPGTPIVYYGDEIGMGDNIFLGDRNGVRTPMQWTPDRNGGFSGADPQRLYLPPIMDPVYGFQAVNVESQLRDRSSLLHWMRRMLAVRRRHAAFGRGSLEFLRPGNRKVLAYLRRHEGEDILCVANLSRSAQAVELDLARFAGRVPLELPSQQAFPPIGALPYMLTLPGYAHYWFELSTTAEPPAWHQEFSLEHELPVLVLTRGMDTLHAAVSGEDAGDIDRRALTQLEREALPAFLTTRRWFAGKSARLTRVRVTDLIDWRDDRGRWLLTTVAAELGDGSLQRYFLPLSVIWEGSEAEAEAVTAGIVAKVRQRARAGLLVDAFEDAAFCRALAEAVRSGATLEGEGQRVEFTCTATGVERLGQPLEGLQRTATEGHSNTGVVLGDQLFIKGYRRMREGASVENEMNRFLSETARYPHVAPFVGSFTLHGADGTTVPLGAVQGFVRNQGDAWSYTIEALDRWRERLGDDEAGDPFEQLGLHRARMAQLGRRIGELHGVLAAPTDDPAFAPEPIRDTDLESWSRAARAELQSTLARLRKLRGSLSPDDRELAGKVLDARKAIEARLAPPSAAALRATRTRHHGHLHLGQVLLVRDDFVVIDFEGDAARSVEERRRKHSPLRDVAGMLRSFAYAAGAARMSTRRAPGKRAQAPEQALDRWCAEVGGAFLGGYREGVDGASSWPRNPRAAARLIDLFVVQQALSEVRSELDNRPDWVGIPLAGLLQPPQVPGGGGA